MGYGVDVAGGRGCTPNEPVASCGRGCVGVCDLEVLSVRLRGAGGLVNGDEASVWGSV